jgi:dTDP-4-dehydrorhamnose 3,5-epimerase
MPQPELVDVGIEGVWIVPLVPHPDDRGLVAEMFRRSWLSEMGEMLQANLSRSRANVLRGLHFHRQQADYWSVLSGTALVGLYDLRKGSPTEGRKAEVDVAAEDLRCLYIPPGVAHGFYTPDGILLQYLVDRYYTGEDEFGVAWDDPDVGIAWPSANPILSDRDRSNPPLVQVLREAPPFQG